MGRFVVTVLLSLQRDMNVSPSSHSCSSPCATVFIDYFPHIVGHTLRFIRPLQSKLEDQK